MSEKFFFKQTITGRVDLEKQYLNATSAIEPNSRIKNLKLIKN